MADEVAALQAGIRAALAAGTPLVFRGGGSKDFYGNPPRGERFETGAHRGIVAYEPSELVITARCGTPLAELEAVLAEQGQMLGFEPPRFGGGEGEFPPRFGGGEQKSQPPQHGELGAATLGGCVAAGLAGPRRATAGALRDFVLGAQLIDGRGELLRFGGQVMKNVAGYDVSRLMAGSLGTLGLILEVSLKVLPRPPAEASCALALPAGTALAALNRWRAQPLPISATCWHAGVLYVRLSGARAAVAAARLVIGGETLTRAQAEQFWASVRDQRHAFFAGDAPLWRLSLPATAAPLEADAAGGGPQLIEWGGALRWLRHAGPAETVRELARRAGGHASLFCGGERGHGAEGVFAPLPAPLLAIHRRLKQQFDPQGLFNPGRLYAEF